MLLYHLYLKFIHFVHTGHANFNSNVAFSFEKGLNGQIHSSTDWHHPMKKISPENFSIASTGGNPHHHPSMPFGKPCIEVYELDPAHLQSELGLTWQVCWWESEVEIELFTNIDILKMIEKRITGGICHTTHFYSLSYIYNLLLHIKSK